MTSSVDLAIIVARSQNGVIGRDGGLPWRLGDDLSFFKSLTMGRPLIMGRNTWESLPRRPLPGREHIVLTRDWAYKAEGARVYSAMLAAIQSAKAIAKRAGVGEVFVIGGESVYRRALPLANRIYLTEVEAEVEGDVYFPDFDESEFREIAREYRAAGEKNDHAFTLRVLQRK